MAKRPIHQKRLRRLRKAVERQPLVAYIDLVRWLKERGYAQTTGKAHELLVDGKVRVDSHAVGREKRAVAAPLSALEQLQGKEPSKPKMQWFPQPYVRAEFREHIRVQK